MKGFIGLIVFILLNIIFCVAISIKRKKLSQKIDFMAVFLSAFFTTVLFHVIAVIEDFKSSQWVMISIPVAFIFGFLISGMSSIIYRRSFLKKKSNHPRI